MSFGLECYAADSTVLLTTTDFMLRIHSVINTYLAYGGSAVFSVPEMTNDGSWYIISASPNMETYSYANDAVFSYGLLASYLIGDGQMTITNTGPTATSFHILLCKIL